MKRVVVNDRMQQGYVYYRVAPVGRDFAPAFRIHGGESAPGAGLAGIKAGHF